MRKYFVSIVIFILFAGCAVAPVARKAYFDEAEYKPYAETGTGIIVGQAFLKTRGGDVKYGAGCTVILNPVTGYSTEWFEKTIQRGIRLEEPDYRVKKYVRQTIGDGEGRFEFENLPAGNYYLACPIFWEIPSGGYGTRTTGGFVYGMVTVEENKTSKIILTR